MKRTKQRIAKAEQKKLLAEMLGSIHELCEKNQIRYFLAYGTLLGAIRHKGFIPWDDDADIWMFRKDYEKLSEIFHASETGTLRLIDIHNTPGFYSAVPKIIDTRTYLKENYLEAIPVGVYIDIFILDYLSDNKNRARYLARKLNIYRTMLNLKMVKPSKGRKKWKNIILNVSRVLLKNVSCSSLLKRLDYGAGKCEAFKESVYCGAVALQVYHAKEIMPAAWFKNRVAVKFCGGGYYAPAEYDRILRHLYGNYKKLPPVSERKSHHAFQAYWKSGTAHLQKERK